MSEAQRSSGDRETPYSTRPSPPKVAPLLRWRVGRWPVAWRLRPRKRDTNEEDGQSADEGPFSVSAWLVGSAAYPARYASEPAPRPRPAQWGRSVSSPLA